MGLALLLQRGLQRGGGVFGLQVQQAAVHGRSGAGAGMWRTSPRQIRRRPRRCASSTLAQRGVAGQPVAGDLDLGRARIAVGQQVGQQLRVSHDSSSGGASALQSSSSVRSRCGAHRHRRFGGHAQLHAREFAAAAPQGR
jgi:hypothetical protein